MLSQRYFQGLQSELEFSISDSKVNDINWVNLGMSDRETMANLKLAMGSAETLGELYALIEDYSYMEFMQTYSQLTPEQQAKLNAIEEHENHHQLVAIR